MGVKTSQFLYILQTAIEMYTINGAYLMHQEERVGSVAVGKEADLVVLDKNIVKCGLSTRRDFETYERNKFSFKHVMERVIRVPYNRHNFFFSNLLRLQV